MKPTGPLPRELETSSELLDFARMRRRFFFDSRINATMVWVSQGDFYISQNPREVITTVLGSCIAVCVRDPDLKLGGMNHFLLPKGDESRGRNANDDLRYGSYSIERLINSIMAHGGRRDRLEIKIFGGATISSDYARIGSMNADFVETYLAREGMPVAGSDVRGNLPRRVIYYPTTGKAMVGSSRDPGTSSIFDIEKKMVETQTPVEQPTRPVLY
jgi:chemotaxis protein CheD